MSRFEPDDQAVLQSNGYSMLGNFGDPALPTQTAASQTVATQTDLAGVSGRDRKVSGCSTGAT